MNKLRTPFSLVKNATGDRGLAPLLPITLNHRGNILETNALLDTGAMVNVLPWSVGIALGAKWEQQTVTLKLTGNLADLEARALLLNAVIGDFPSVRLAFAWTQSDHVPVLLGMTNFFMEFDACFFRSEGFFEVVPHRAGPNM